MNAVIRKFLVKLFSEQYKNDLGKRLDDKL